MVGKYVVTYGHNDPNISPGDGGPNKIPHMGVLYVTQETETTISGVHTSLTYQPTKKAITKISDTEIIVSSEKNQLCTGKGPIWNNN